MRKKILITGAAGFLGSHLCKKFLDQGFNVTGIDNFCTGNKNNIIEFFESPLFKFIEYDITKKLNLRDNFDYILHFASPASPVDYLNMPIKTLRVGSVGTENILNLADKNNSKILVASTSEIYGDPIQHPQKESYFGNVNPVGPRGVYDEAKRYLEALTTAYKNKKKLDVRIARIFNTYGPKMRKNDGRAIPNFINQAINNKDFTIYGDGLQTRSFCYVDDTIEGIYKLLNSSYNSPVNIGNPTEHSILELVKIIKSLTSSNSKIAYLDLPENDPKVRQPDISIAKEFLKWEPKIDLFEGLLKTINYYKKL